MQYTCRIDGDLMVCHITPDRDLSAPVFCFSGMAPMAPVAGGTLIRDCGSYTEVQLPDLTAGAPHAVTIRYGDGYAPTNRAWMPLGPYLRVGSDLIPLPPTPAGQRPKPVVDPAPLDGLALVPQPTSWAPGAPGAPGEGHLPANGFAFADDALDAVADLAARQGMPFRGDVPITLVRAELGAELGADLPQDAYEIDIAPTGITLTASGYGGRFYGGITLLTLLQRGALPLGRLTDAPRFAWRGQHLDTARHYYEPATILRLLDLMALLKLNRFHWHFADDEAFRIEIDSIPALWQKTALRGEGQMMPGLFAGAPVQGGSYSKDTARAVIAHAKRLNIEVMPEIEAPAHALCITTLYPDTRDPADTGTERSVQGYAGNVLNPAQPRTWEVLEAMVADIAALFPFNHLHLGCDELPKDTWMGSPMARDLMAREGLTTTEDLEGWTINKLAAIAVRHGQRPAAWEEAAQGCQGGIGHDAILFSWTGQGPGLEAARAGYDVVMTPAQQVYLDMAETGDTDDWGASWAAFVDLPDTVTWDPVPDPALTDRIIGVQGAFWSEFTTRDDEIWPMLMPRLLGVAAMAWQISPPNGDEIAKLSTHYGLHADGQMVLQANPAAG